MKIVINENAGNTVIKQIERSGLLQTAKLFGGWNKLISISKQIPELDSYVKNILKGVAIENFSRVKYDFKVVGIDFNDIGDE